jgi:hypothetical protein
MKIAGSMGTQNTLDLALTLEQADRTQEFQRSLEIGQAFKVDLRAAFDCVRQWPERFW